MRLLLADNPARGDQARKRPAAVGVGIVTALMVVLSPGSRTPEAEAAFPGRNGRIVFQAGQDPTSGRNPPSRLDYDIFTVLPRGAGLIRVTEGPHRDVLPSWSPDGSTIVFTRSSPHLAAGDIFVVNPDGSGLTNLTSTLDADELDARWSPDGRRVVFSRATSAPICGGCFSEDFVDYDLFIMDADGGNVIELIDEPGSQFSPSWSPDGKWIAFSDFEDRSIELVTSDGSRRATLVSPEPFFEGATLTWLDWSPDGQKLVFGTLPNDEGRPEIWVVNVDGTGMRRLTSGSDSRAPAWSPDGKWIAFSSSRSGLLTIYKMRPDGSDPIKLISLQLYGSGTSWGPRP